MFILTCLDHSFSEFGPCRTQNEGLLFGRCRDMIALEVLEREYEMVCYENQRWREQAKELTLAMREHNFWGTLMVSQNIQPNIGWVGGGLWKFWRGFGEGLGCFTTGVSWITRAFQILGIHWPYTYTYTYTYILQLFRN